MRDERNVGLMSLDCLPIDALGKLVLNHSTPESGSSIYLIILDMLNLGSISRF